MNDLIEAIRIKLNIPDNLFINNEIESHLKDIAPQEYSKFFSDLSGDKFSYKTGMDRVAIVSASYKERKHALLMRNIPSKAQELANKLYALKQQAGDKYELIIFNKIMLDGKNYFNDKELIIIDKLGGKDLMRVIDTQSMSFSVSSIQHEMEKVNQASAEQMALTLNDTKLIGDK